MTYVINVRTISNVFLLDYLKNNQVHTLTMGAIWLIIYNVNDISINMDFIKGFMNMVNRGPTDTSYITQTTTQINQLNKGTVQLHLTKKEVMEYTQYTVLAGYHRLAINDLTLNGTQPFEDPIVNQIKNFPELRSRVKRKLFCNGEIYNYKNLVEDEEFVEKDLQSTCDVEVILPLYIKHGINETLINKLDGDFAFVMTENVETFDLKNINVYVARDKLGVKPMYMVKNVESPHFYMFVSELKAIPLVILENPSFTITELPIASYWSFQNSCIDQCSCENEMIQYYNWDTYKLIASCTVTTPTPEILSGVYNTIQSYLTNAIIKRWDMSQASVGILLSGGFDSSIILGILINYLVGVSYDFVANPIHVFTVGDCQSNEDVANAKAVVEFLEGLHNIDIHHHIIIVSKATIDAQIEQKAKDIIYMIETFDNMCIREAIVFSYIFEYIKSNTSVKVLLVGEGLDEVCGYKQLFKSTDEHFQAKSVQLIQTYGQYFVNCSEKLAGSYGLELRYPYLDQTFLEYMLSIHPKLKRPQIYDHNMQPIDKYIVRKSFDANDFPNSDTYLTNDILWRTSARVTDCYPDFCDIFDKHFNRVISDSDYSDFRNKMSLQNEVVPTSKEQMYYKKVYDSFFPNVYVIKRYWSDILNN